MNRFTVALTLLIIFTMVMIGAVLLFGNGPAMAPDDGNLTARAIRIALADPGVAEATNNSFDKTCFVTNVSAYGDDGRSGLTGSGKQLIKVSLQFSSTWSTGENRGLTIDVGSGEILGREQYFRRLSMPPYHESFLVPPGASWYRLINGAKNTRNVTIDMRPTITFEPADARVYATVVDDGNLSRFLAGETFAPLQYTDLDTGRTDTCDNRLITTPWAINISVPWTGYNGPAAHESPSPDYYIILKNGDRVRPVEIEYDLMRNMAAFWS